LAKSAEFILEFEAKQILVLEPFGPYYEDVIKRLGEQPDLQVVECASLKEMAGLCRQVRICLILAHCADQRQASRFVDLLQACQNEVRDRRARIVITVSNDFVCLQPRFVR
jgi:hypothetical protein